MKCIGRGSILFIALTAVAAGTVGAQTARSGGGNANAQLMQQMQQLASERTRLQAENTSLKKELEDTKKERDSLKTAQKGTDQRVKASAAALSESTSRREAAEQELKQTKDKMGELIAKFRETAQSLREVETERTASKQTLAVRDQELSVCKERVLTLYKLNGEILSRLENDSVWSRAARAEPFTRIKRAQMDNLVDDYKDRAHEAAEGPVNPKPAPK